MTGNGDSTETKSAAAAATILERRKSTRHKALKGGRIVFNRGWGSVACIVRNVSEVGARLHVESTLGIPAAFTLVLDDGSSQRECVVRWRNADALGVEFA